MDTPSQPTGATIAPPAFAIGITLVLVGLIPAVGFAVLPSFLGQRRREPDDAFDTTPRDAITNAKGAL